ncbi:hypothetical protein [Streptomyces sp. NBC_00443]|uniref:hypothetical protein n=1 Tax=Streptomyces sp. NBC_00443 TaxID=2975743 RepID=UPI002E2317AC
MGERQSGGGQPGRRRAHPDDRASGHASGPAVALDDAELEALLFAAVLRGHPWDTEGEQRAVAAFRAARAAGEHRARTRRRDDWRPREPRRLPLSVKSALSLFVASLALGGVAVAAIGSSGSSEGAGDDRARPTSSAGSPGRPTAAHPSAASGAASAKPSHPPTAQDTEARCRAYDQVEGRGKALDSTAWQRLVAAAGGADKVAAYCAEQLAGAKRGSASGPTSGPTNGPAKRPTNGPAKRPTNGPANGPINGPTNKADGAATPGPPGP